MLSFAEGSPEQSHRRRTAMCYEEQFFQQRTTTKAQKREEPQSVIDRLRPSLPPDRAKPETDKPKEVEPELETV